MRRGRESDHGERAKMMGAKARLEAASLAQHCALDPPVRRMVEKVAATFALSARGVHRLLRVARTIADLSGCDVIQRVHVAEALNFRRLTHLH